MLGLSNIKKGHTPDYAFLFAFGLLLVFGMIMLSSASSDLGKVKFNDTYYYLKHQIYYGLSLGIIGFLASYFIPYKKLQNLATIFLVGNILALLAVFTPLGIRFGGATRWINLGPFSIQPAEILKLTFIIYLSAWLTGKQKSKRINFIEGFLPFLIISAVIAVLVFIQPATTTIFILLASSLLVYFINGARVRYVLGFILIGVLLLTIVVSITPYRFNRITNFFSNDSSSLLGANYHRNQALMAIGSGGMFGVGYGQSTSKYKFLPEPIGDSIFAVIAEELGFIASTFLIALYIFFFMRGITIAKHCRDQFGKLVVIGFISIIAIQTFVNIGAISGFLPLTGIPLPFISYGGTALAIFMTMGGIIANISKYS
ncbi:stage V sporulation protein E [Candidatus Wolfebacteria bacterium CG10_big_fil_rev_8_21_14_0_10_31_9]|uniref:Probable peptidoglycan glycosyltransferase FtsW n=1 Tax=Candidatus Wolfebacteria bacterium CG10_big_fil_rev_8_21_14_0_10_31_9 TaxID=1975070 RepID=A0A2H0RCF0_9BACT|nr:MAG: stage V sporulation protein E [Candidatus Wolfebacteria bacterium CG10_big_fil_rev_8_21_14_0_10_31_9]